MSIYSGYYIYGTKVYSEKELDLEFYTLPTIQAFSKITKGQFKAIELGDICDILYYNLDVTRDFLIRGNIYSSRYILRYVKSLRGLLDSDRDLIRLYCFNDRNVFPFTNEIKSFFLKEYGVNISRGICLYKEYLYWFVNKKKLYYNN